MGTSLPFSNFVQKIIFLICSGFIPIPESTSVYPKERFVKRLYLSRSNRKIAGVCGGLAEYLEMDPTPIRLIAIFLLIFTGILPMVIVYLIAWAVIPDQP